MDNTIAIIITGIYTVVYVVIFFIQKAQIDKNKSVILSMQSFMNIFKVDEVKKYVEMRDERIMEQAKNIASSDKKVKTIIETASKISLEQVSKVYVEKMGEKHAELLLLATDVLKTIDPEKRADFIKQNLKNNKEYFTGLDLTLNNNES
jgi:hypothetical protein